MANIVLFIPPSTGAMNASYKLARDLIASGDVVSYVGVPDCEEYVCRNGFAFRPIFAKWFPKGFFPAAAKRSTLTGLKRLAHRKDSSRYIRRFLETLVGEARSEFAVLMADVLPDLCLVASAFQDSTIWALLLHELNIRCAYLNNTFIRPQDKDDHLPPVWTSIIPDGSLLFGLRVSLAWRSLLWRKRLAEWTSARLGLGLDWKKQFIRLAKVCGYPVRSLNFDDMISPKLQLPEILLWSLDFDFPGADKPNRFYVGPFVDLARHQTSFPWERIVEGRKLIYCALGSMCFLTPLAYRKFYQSVVNVASMYPDWNWILSVGDSIKPRDLHSVPQNVLVVEWAPQLEILAKAHIMITHAGANTVRECIWFGVPMIAFPIALDHPGTAARVVFHGLGLVGDIRRVSADKIQSLVQTLEANPSFRSQVVQMRERFRRIDSGTASRIIGSLIVGGNPRVHQAPSPEINQN